MKRSAIICDIDGTIAHGTDRTPYDWTQVGSDTVDPAIFKLLLLLEKEHHILMVTGRDSICRAITVEWLNRHEVPWDQLFMRLEGDKRPDTEVKLELFKDKLEPKYDIQLVLEDRDKVVAMWRSLGLKCLQVQPGDF